MDTLTIGRTAKTALPHLFSGFIVWLLLGCAMSATAQVAVNTGQYSPNGTVQALASDENYIYIGGQFTGFTSGENTLEIPYLARFSKEDYALDESWNLGLDNHVYALAIDGDFLYLGGQFTQVLSSERNSLAKVNKSGAEPVLDGWLAPADAPVRAMALVADALYVGGQFSEVNGQQRYALAKLDKNTADVDVNFVANFTSYLAYSDETLTGKILTLFYEDATDSLYVGGAFGHHGVVFDNHYNYSNATGVNELAKIDATTGAISPTWLPEPNNEVSDMKLVGDSLFIAGRFTSVGGQSRRSIAKIHARSTGRADELWNPDPPRNNFVFALSLYEGDLYAGGGFNSIGGESIVRIAKLYTTGSGRADASWTMSNGGSFNVMMTEGQTLLTGGNFAGLGGEASINRFGVIDVSAQQVGVSGGGLFISQGDDSPSTDDETDFGLVTVGETVAEHTFTLHNLGARPLEIADIQISGTDAAAFEASGFTAPFEVPARSTTDFSITFNPSGSGEKSAIVQVSSNDPNQPSFTFLIAGRAQTLLGASEDKFSKVYPNPASAYFSFDHQGLAPGDHLVLIDVNGKVARRFPVSDEGRYATSGISEGVYILMLEHQDNRISAGRVVIND